MYICEDCKNTVSELKEVYEHVGGFQSGNQGYTYTDDECSCGGTYVEAVKCKECGGWASELFGDMCEDCLAENATMNNAIFYGSANKEFININSFYVHVFGEFQIDRILNNAFFKLTSKAERHDKANEFCLEDKESFGQYLEKNTLSVAVATSKGAK